MATIIQCTEVNTGRVTMLDTSDSLLDFDGEDNKFLVSEEAQTTTAEMRIIISKYFGIPFESVELIYKTSIDKNESEMQLMAKDYLDFTNVTYRVNQTTSSAEDSTDFAKVQGPVIKMFPFCLNEPQWAQGILLDKFNINDYKNTLRLFNAGEAEVAEGDSKEYQLIEKRHRHKINFLLSQDQSIKQMTESEIEGLSKQNEKEFNFVQIGKKALEAVKITLSEDISIADLKSFLLTKTGGIGFFLEHFVNNTDTLKDLQTKKVSGEENTINAYLLPEKKDRDYFSLKMKLKKGDAVETVEIDRLDCRLKVDEFFKKIEKLVPKTGKQWFEMKFQDKYLVNAENIDIKKMRLGDLGINRYSDITFSVQERKINSDMAAVDIKFFHQQYFKFKGDSEIYDYKAFIFDDKDTVEKILGDLKSQINDDGLPETLRGGKNLALFSAEDGSKCLPNIEIREYLNKKLEIKIDFEDHIVLQFRKHKEGRQYSFCHIDQVDSLKSLRQTIEFEDVVRTDEERKQNVDEKLKLDKDFKYRKYTEFLFNQKLLANDTELTKKLLQKRPQPCEKLVLKVQLSKFTTRPQHFVNKMEDLWVAKAYMAQVYDENFCKSDPKVGSSKKQKKAIEHFTSLFCKQKAAAADPKEFSESLEAFKEMMTEFVEKNCEQPEIKSWEAERLNLEKQLNDKKDEIEKDGVATLSNRFMYQRLVKLHTSEGLYKVLGKHFSKGLYQEAAMYIKILMINVRDFGFQYNYKSINKPVYVGFDSKSIAFKREDYLEGRVFHWPSFTQCTKQKSIANMFSKDQQSKMVDGQSVSTFEGEIMLFEIYLSNSNSAVTNVDLSNKDFTHYEAEEEVLLLPNFCFQVTDIHRDSKQRTVDVKKADNTGSTTVSAKTTTYTLVEMPNMNLNELRPIHQNTIVWFCPQPSAAKKEEIEAFAAQQVELDIPFEHTTTQEATFSAIKDSIRATLIVSDSSGYDLARELTSGISFNHSISAIIILNADGKLEEDFKEQLGQEGEGDILAQIGTHLKKTISAKVEPLIQFVNTMDELKTTTEECREKASSGFEKIQTKFKKEVEKFDLDPVKYQ